MSWEVMRRETGCVSIQNVLERASLHGSLQLTLADRSYSDDHRLLLLLHLDGVPSKICELKPAMALQNPKWVLTRISDLNPYPSQIFGRDLRKTPFLEQERAAIHRARLLRNPLFWESGQNLARTARQIKEITNVRGRSWLLLCAIRPARKR